MRIPRCRSEAVSHFKHYSHAGIQFTGYYPHTSGETEQNMVYVPVDAIGESSPEMIAKQVYFSRYILISRRIAIRFYLSLPAQTIRNIRSEVCLLYTSDAADD